MLGFLNLIRWKNLFMIALVQCLIKYALFLPFGVSTALNSFQYFLLILSTICIAAAGYVINDIYDVETDLINKPEKVVIGNVISEKVAYNLYITLNVIGVFIGFYISYAIGKNEFFAIFVVISALLYVYASYLKQTFLMGNIIISILVALSVLIVGIFELIPAMTNQNQGIQLAFFKILFEYALFAFMINLIREIAKDLEDFDGDYKTGMQTLPIVIGRKRATTILFVTSLMPLIAVVYYVNNTLYKQPVALIYYLIFIMAPLIYLCILIVNAKTKKDFRTISKVLKFVMLLGMLSILIYPFILLH
ncbi:geranylgeranylglycerol-phosphate geranylgeranyltransferase [Yeosuana sp. AK3]